MAREIKEIITMASDDSACSLSLERKDWATSAPIYRNRGVATRESYFNESTSNRLCLRITGFRVMGHSVTRGIRQDSQGADVT